MANPLATANKQAMSGAFRTTGGQGETEMLLTEAFPTQGASQASQGLLRPRVQHRNADRRRSEKAFRPCKSLSEACREVRGKGETKRPRTKGATRTTTRNPKGGEGEVKTLRGYRKAGPRL